jgi:hypothetical protein
MAMSTFYIGYSVIRMDFDTLFYISLLLIIIESVVLVANTWMCPLTKIAKQYTNEESANFDIFLPKLIARYNKEIFSTILFIIAIIYIYNRWK